MPITISFSEKYHSSLHHYRPFLVTNRYILTPASSSVNAKSGRIVFIDILRAYAILMMLQGHFVDTLLAESYRNPESSLFYLWSFMRGMTAPIFFTVTGLVFIFLLLRDGRPIGENERVKKGIRRGFYLVFVGYLIKMNFPGLLTFQIFPWFWAIDVLHIIGIAILGLIAVFHLRAYIGGSLGIWMFCFGMLTFLIDPWFTEPNWDHLPTFLANYLTVDYGSNFTIVPWLGFAFFGGILGYSLNRRPAWAFSHWLPMLLMILGWALTLGAHAALVGLYELTGWENFQLLFNNNYLFWRLGHVLITVSIFMWVIPRIGKIPKLASKIGSETLTIYAVHYIVLYGTWLGLGLRQIIGYRTLGPIACMVGAILFVISFIVLIAYIEPIRDWLDSKKPIWLTTQKRKSLIFIKRLWRKVLLTTKTPSRQ